MLMPALQRNRVARDTACRVRLANAVRELANVFTRMPNHATPKLPPMPIRLNSRMIRTLYGSNAAEIRNRKR